MKITDKTKIDLFLALAILFMLGYWVSPAFASGDDITQVTDVDTTATGGQAFNTMGSQNNNYESLGLGIANQLGAGAIADCMITTQDNFTLYARQRGKLNKWCAAEAYEVRGMHSMAARLRCEIKDIRSLFENRADCISENTYRPVKEVPRGTIDFRAEIAQSNEAVRADLQAEIQTLRETIENMEKARQRRPAQPVQTVEPFLNESKRSALIAIKGD